MRFCYVVRFRDNHNNPKAFQTMAKTPKAAGKKLRTKGARVTSVRKK